MTMFETESAPSPAARTALAPVEIDLALTAQLMVAWAGEGGESPRLGWWRSDLVSTYGGLDLFRRLLPHTALWAVLQGAREAARRTDARLRAQHHDADRLLSLFNLGFEVDERLDQRLLDLKRSGADPQKALPGLAGLELEWRRDRFLQWVTSHGGVDTATTPAGRQIPGEPPATLDERVRGLVAALAPLADTYPLPHFTIRRPA
jgi:hypothetical protein